MALAVGDQLNGKRPASCSVCGTKVWRRSRDLRVYAAHYCGRKCQSIGQTRSQTGRRSPKRNAILRTCLHCGSAFDSKPCLIRDGKGKYCSRACVTAAKAAPRCHCEVCGTEFPAYGGKANRFCSKPCYSQWMGENQHGEAHPRWGKSLEAGRHFDRECTFCRKPVRVHGRRADLPRIFCSRHCSSAWVSENLSGPTHPNSLPAALLPCAHCGTTVGVQPYRARRGRGRVFCSKECQAEWQSENVRGDRHPNWRGGNGDSERKTWLRSAGGSRWKRVCRLRDAYTCWLCGKQHHPRSAALHVHHAVPFASRSEFRSDPANGLCLCARCPDGRGHWWLHSTIGKATREVIEAEVVAKCL